MPEGPRPLSQQRDEGRVCLTQGPTVSGMAGTITAYLYDAEGNRVGKGTITTSLPFSQLSCNLDAYTFTLTAEYVLGQGGEQVTEFDGGGNWVHTNAYAGGQLIASYDTAGGGTYASPALHYQLSDWLGNRRMQVSPSGVAEETCTSSPFGDQLTCGLSNAATADDATEHHFTGKERDTESGLDYFGARYYGSSMGRFMSPDWSAKVEPVPYSKLDDPQSLNLYSYVRNNPLSRVDIDGHSDYFWQKLGNYLGGKGWNTNAQVKGLTVSQTALTHTGSKDWAINTVNVSGTQVFKPGSDKCNQYVGDTLAESGHQAPMVPDGNGGMRLATAHELADPSIHIAGLSDTKPMSEAKIGDVVAQAHGDVEGHAGFIVGPGQTSSANANEGGTVTVNNWAFRNPDASPNNGERNGSNSPAPVVRTPDWAPSHQQP